MDKLIINNKVMEVLEYQGERVVNYGTIAKVHKVDENNLRQNFKRNKQHFIENEDYFALKKNEVSDILSLTSEEKISKFAPKIHLFTKTGYLMLVKSLTDDLSWKIQRELVTHYFATAHAERENLINDDINQQHIEERLYKLVSLICEHKEPSKFIKLSGDKLYIAVKDFLEEHQKETKLKFTMHFSAFTRMLKRLPYSIETTKYRATYSDGKSKGGPVFDFNFINNSVKNKVLEVMKKYYLDI